MMKEVKKLVYIPTPSSISYLWNFGSLLGSFLVVQIVTGVFLTFHYEPTIQGAFSSVVYISEDIPFGWVLRSAHANGASFFFLLLYAHIGRGIYYKSFVNVWTWVSGVSIFLLSMGTAFLGYVLPWGQMSLWGATVITNLLSALPFGGFLVEWVWGGFSVSGPTLSRFFSIHFLLPFGIAVSVLVHLALLHEKGSQNPLGLPLQSDKIFFHPFFSVKDILGLTVVILFFGSTILLYPDCFMDPDNFVPANSLSTPAHIQPEWYFLFAYAILRSVPSKLGGVVALLCSIFILFILPLVHKSGKGVVFSVLFWVFVSIFALLTWVGSMPAEGPMLKFGQVLSPFYFFLLLLLSIC